MYREPHARMANFPPEFTLITNALQAVEDAVAMEMERVRETAAREVTSTLNNAVRRLRQAD